MTQMVEARLPDPSHVVTPCGGGGLAAGLALALPEAEVTIVEPEGWDDMCRSLEAGWIEPVGPNPPPTACDALQTLATRPINFAVLRERVPRGLAVSEAQVRAAQRFAFARLRLVIEPGGAVALAAALAGKVALDGRTAIVLSGGNVDPAAFAQMVESEN
jgi:threonine dehydratase